jgi:hypothetical protein
MNRKVTLIALTCSLFLLMGGLFLSSCEYEWIVPSPGSSLNPNDTISFAGDILPIFSAHECDECHSTNGTPPDLTTANAWSSITGMGLVNTTAPEASILYDYTLQASSFHSWRKVSATESSLILQWIKQGAKNN